MTSAFNTRYAALETPHSAKLKGPFLAFMGGVVTIMGLWAVRDRCPTLVKLEKFYDHVLGSIFDKIAGFPATITETAEAIILLYFFRKIDEKALKKIIKTPPISKNFTVADKTKYNKIRDNTITSFSIIRGTILKVVTLTANGQDGIDALSAEAIEMLEHPYKDF